MRGWIRFSVAAVVLSALPVPSAEAGSVNLISVAPGSVEVALGESFDLFLEMNFDDETTGGGVTLTFDSALIQLDSITFDPDFEDDPDFRCPGNAFCPGDASFVAFGGIGGLSGQHRIASLAFSALGTVGSTQVLPTLTNEFGSSWGRFP